MDRVSASPYCSSYNCLRSTLTAVAVLSSLVAAAALAILFVPPVAAVLTFASLSLYIVLGASSLLALVTALGACSLSEPEEPIRAPVSSLKSHFQQEPTILYLPLVINRHTYYVLNPSFYQRCLSNPNLLSGVVEREHIVEIVSLGEKPLVLPIHCEHYLKGKTPHFLEMVAQVKEKITSQKPLLIAAGGYSEYNLCLAVAEYMLQNNSMFLEKGSVKSALESRLAHVEKAIGEATELKTRQAFLSDAAIEVLIQFLRRS